MPFLHNKFNGIALTGLILFGLSQVAAATDFDADGVPDLFDNCTQTANADQRDTDGDHFGNLCDADFNNDGFVNFPDLLMLQQAFFATGDLDEDMTGDGVVNFSDLLLFRGSFFRPPGPGSVLSGLQVIPAFTSISVSNPMQMRQEPGDDANWYVAERAGVIKRFANVPSPAETVVVLDIVDRVSTSFEGGLLGFAFDPDFASNGRLFVSYTATGNALGNPLDSRISMFTVDPLDPGTFDRNSEVVIIEIDQPYSNHNGGDLAFGPDGFIYLSLGDGGSGGDPQNNGQDNSSLLGTIVRLDVNVTAADIADGITYRIPPGNPFASSTSCATGCPEIYATGFRNPWRFSFDSQTGGLYVGDVGQGAREEIDLVVAGGNYGWRCYEGNLQFNPSGCLPAENYEFPLIDYGRFLGNSVSGGYVYRGTAIPGLQGVYLYGDFGSGRIWGLIGGKDLGELIDTSLSLVAFAQGNDGELYVLDLFPGSIFRIGVAE